MATPYFEKPAVFWGSWPENKRSKQRSISPPRSQRLEIEENRRAAAVFNGVVNNIIDLTGSDSDDEGSVHTLLDSDAEDPYHVSDTEAPHTGWKGPYPSAAQDYEHWQMMEYNAAIKNYVYEPDVQYSSSLIASLKRPFAELKAVDEYEARFRPSDLLYGTDSTLGQTIPDLNERMDRIAEQVELSKEEIDYVLHCWEFPGMDGYTLFELDHWYVGAETIHRRDGQYYGTPIGGRKQVRLGSKFPIHHIHPDDREAVNAILVDYDKHRK